MSNLSRHTPRGVREKRAYRLVQAGTVTGGLGVITLVLAIVGVVSAAWPVILLIVAALCAFGFMRTTGQR